MQDFLEGFNIFLKLFPISVLVVLVVNAVKKSLEGWKSVKPYSKISIIMGSILSILVGVVYYYMSKGITEMYYIQIFSILINSTYIWCLSVNFYEIIMKNIFEFVSNIFKNLSKTTPVVEPEVKEEIKEEIIK